MTIVELKNVSKSYGDKNVLNNLSTKIEEGTFNVIMGASGFRVIIVTVANSLGNIRVFELLPKLKTKKYGWCIA